MTAHSPVAAAPRLTFPRIALMLAGAVVLFGAAYLIGGVFGRAADDKLDGATVAVVPAISPSDAPLLTIAAKDVAFDTTSIRVPAGTAARLRVANEDAGMYHNIAVYRDPQASGIVQRGALFDGPKTRDYVFEPFTAGSYFFQCDLHPSMSGTLTVE
jgi:plastocyanin